MATNFRGFPINSTLTLAPAYGRDYPNSKAAISAWTQGADFRIAPSGVYCSIRDLPALISECGVQFINIRYKKLSRVAVLKAGA